MFNGMMDPEMFRIAQEQISRMSPAELARIQQQMMSNPDLLKMASESMKNLSTEDFKYAAEQLKNTHPEEIAEIGEKIANATPEEIAAMHSRSDTQIAYEISGAEILKKKGNELHGQGKYYDALQKYLLAKKNLKGVPSAKAKPLLLACSLNLMSCYLKTRQYDECIKEGSEVLAYDSNNVKALYRRGQAYKELGKFEAAVTDLSKAHEISPDDDTIAEVIRDVKESLKKDRGARTVTSSGLVIEEITEEDDAFSVNDTKSSPEFSVTHPSESGGSSKNNDETLTERPSTNSECLEALKDDPDAIKSFQNFISNADPDTLAKVGGAGGNSKLPPDMLKTARKMIGKMSSDELQNMIKLASSFEGDNPLLNGTPLDRNFGPGSVPPNIMPEMMKAANDMMSKMRPDELQKMFDKASTLRQRDSVSTATTSSTSGALSSDSTTKRSRAEGNGADDGSNESSESSSSIPSSLFVDLQERMRKQMRDPAMRQNMSPEMMANMSEQSGVKLSREDAEKGQKAMASLSPEDLDRMIRWADRIQTGVQVVKKTKKWLLGRSGMILGICMLILAIIVRYLGFIGS